MTALLTQLQNRWHLLPRWLRFLAGFSAIFASVGLIAFGVVWWHYASIASTYDMAALTHDQYETLFVDVKGEPVGNAGEIERELVTLNDVPPHFVQAIIATEDARFYTHPGFDIIGLSRAAVKNFASRGIKQGGSTITQQLARNAFGLQGRSYERKLKEIFLAMRIEREYSKDQILTHYVNRIYLGHGCSGVGAAARCYFGKDVQEITLVEAATLAGIIKAPVAFSPVTQPTLAKEKRNLTLRRMAEIGAITDEVAVAASGEPVIVHYDKTRVRTGYMLAAARGEFRRLGLKPGSPTQMAMTLRLDWQRRLDKLMREHLASIANSDKNALQGAVIVLDNRSGAILAMQGGRDFVTSPFNRALDGIRPPGTAFLPLVYASAVTVKPDVIDARLLDGPLDNRQAMIGGLIGTLGEWGADGEPVAYTGGTITPMQALVESRTAATVRLGYEVGLEPLRSAIMRCGFTTPLRAEAAFTLGQSHVRLIEVARAFTAIANDGRLCSEPHLFPAPAVHGDEIFAPAAASNVRETLISSMTRPEYRKPMIEHGLAEKSIAGFGGITYDRSDAWFIGSDRALTCLIWIGHDTDVPISPQATAATAALPLWAAVFSMVTDGQTKGWGAKDGLASALAVPLRATIVEDEAPVPAIHPVSKVVLGIDPYQAITSVDDAK